MRCCRQDYPKLTLRLLFDNPVAVELGRLAQPARQPESGFERVEIHVIIEDTH